MQYTLEDIKEFKRNAVEILRKNTQYATARATERAFDTLIALEELIDTYTKLKGETRE